MLIVEQNARRALELADRAYVLRSGEITERGSGTELLARADLFETYLGSKR
jgi:branched-chain amino acid transport system ATP-binding protein